MRTRAITQLSNFVFGLSGPLIVGAFSVCAIHHGYDFTQTLGYLFVHLGWILMAWLGVGLLLLGLVSVANRRKSTSAVSPALENRIDKYLRVDDDKDHKSYYVP